MQRQSDTHTHTHPPCMTESFHSPLNLLPAYTHTHTYRTHKYTESTAVLHNASRQAYQYIYCIAFPDMHTHKSPTKGHTCTYTHCDTHTHISRTVFPLVQPLPVYFIPLPLPVVLGLVCSYYCLFVCLLVHLLTQEHTRTHLQALLVQYTTMLPVCAYNGTTDRATRSTVQCNAVHPPAQKYTPYPSFFPFENLPSYLFGVSACVCGTTRLSHLTHTARERWERASSEQQATRNKQHDSPCKP